MQHQSQHPTKGATTGKTDFVLSEETISSEAIERHIAEGKRLQAEAIAAFFAGCARRIGAALHRQPSDNAVPHRA